MSDFAQRTTRIYRSTKGDRHPGMQRAAPAPSHDTRGLATTGDGMDICSADPSRNWKDRDASGCHQLEAERLVLQETPDLFERSAPHTIRWCDGRLATEWNMDKRAVVTTANATWMPEFPVAAPGQICTRVDGRWGPQEYSLWPQLYHPRVVHHSCIPVKDNARPLLGIDIRALWFRLTPHDWQPDLNCGVPDLGFLSRSCLQELTESVTGVIKRFRSCGTSNNDQKLGDHLVATLRQGLDRLRILAAWRTHTLALAAHLQRLSLELCGLMILYEVVQPRVNDPSFVAKNALAVRGAFTAEAGTAQGLHRLGIPVWFIQPLTKCVRVLEITDPVHVSSLLSDELSVPRLLSGPADLAGIVHHPGDWPFKMQEEVLKSLFDAVMPPLLDDASKKSDAPPAKKLRTEAEHDLDRVATARRPMNESRRPTHRGTRAATAMVPQHPSLSYRPPDAGTIPPLWAQVLGAVGSLPPPNQSLVYYWPPPFLFQGVGSKVDRYYHNYARIRSFCRQRLLDPTIAASPLRIAEWRDSLWGDYRVDGEATAGSLTSQKKERRQIQQNVRSLFSKTARLPSYDANQPVSWGDVTLTLGACKDAGVCAQVLWEVHEVNWRCELLALDARLTGSHSWGMLQRWEHENQVAAVCTDGTGLRVVPDWEGGETPLATWETPPERAWSESRRTYRELIRVMARWPGLPDELRILPESILMYEGDGLLCLERAVVQFYVSSFVRTFGRLPIPPAVFPAAWL